MQVVSAFGRFVKYFVEDVFQCQNEVNTLGKKLLITLRDLFWHIDGHHYLFAQRASAAIPDIFTVFQNFNMPELSKHRKRRTRNISSEQLQDAVLDLSTVLESPYWERLPWKNLRTHFFGLCESLTSYDDYLDQKNKKMKIIHRSPTPPRELATNLRIHFLYHSEKTTIPPQLHELDELISVKPCYEYVSIVDMLPSDPVRKHRMLNTILTTGLSVSCIMLVYAPGSNVGNLQFMWRVPESNDPAASFESSQSIVEVIKNSYLFTIPVR